ncbi:MAG: beta-galactosidase [Caldilineaceae bacterium]|nr:beta-galactosidase [Caldilineaceae bacterium]
MPRKNGILIGTHYEYPFGGMATRPEWLPQGEDDWRRDLGMIKDTGFDSIRIRIGLDSSLDEVGRLLDICQELDIGVLFGFATFYVHNSFIEAFPDAKVIDRNGVAYPQHEHDFSWQRACINHPEYRRQRDQLLADCATRFATHAAIIDWDVHNEPSIGPGDHSCYNPHTLDQYREDLAARFSSISQVNERWGTDFEEFAAVKPPTEAETDTGSFWRDWREFIARNLNEFLLGGINIIKQHAPGVRASFNYTDPYHIQRNGQDWWILPQLDYASSSHYWGSGPRTGAEAGSRIALLKALAPGSQAWLTECQGGPFRSDILWRGINIDAEVNQVFSYASHAHYFYRWDPLMSGPEPWINHMVDADEYDTERRLATKRVIADLRRYEDLIAAGDTVPARVGIYLTREMVWAANARAAPLSDAVVGLYALFMDLGYEVTFVPHGFDADCELEVVAVPFSLGISAEEGKAFRSYMEQGGRVIAELPMTNLAECQQVGEQLGLACREWIRPIYFIAGWSVNDSEGNFGGYAFHDQVLLDDYMGQPIATFRDSGEPALISTGPEGRLLIPTFALGRSYFSSLHRGLRRLIKGWLPETLAPDVTIQGVPDEYRSLVEARLVESDRGNLLFLINRSGYDWEVEVQPRGYQPEKVRLPTHGATHRLVRRTGH